MDSAYEDVIFRTIPCLTATTALLPSHISTDHTIVGKWHLYLQSLDCNTCAEYRCRSNQTYIYILASFKSHAIFSQSNDGTVDISIFNSSAKNGQ